VAFPKGFFDFEAESRQQREWRDLVVFAYALAKGSSAAELLDAECTVAPL
jgi:hypothetical protein